jgi:hypothetical protein
VAGCRRRATSGRVAERPERAWERSFEYRSAWAAMPVLAEVIQATHEVQATRPWTYNVAVLLPVGGMILA